MLQQFAQLLCALAESWRRRNNIKKARDEEKGRETNSVLSHVSGLERGIYPVNYIISENFYILKVQVNGPLPYLGK